MSDFKIIKRSDNERAFDAIFGPQVDEADMAFYEEVMPGVSPRLIEMYDREVVHLQRVDDIRNEAANNTVQRPSSPLTWLRAIWVSIQRMVKK